MPPTHARRPPVASRPQTSKPAHHRSYLPDNGDMDAEAMSPCASPFILSGVPFVVSPDWSSEDEMGNPEYNRRFRNRKNQEIRRRVAEQKRRPRVSNKAAAPAAGAAAAATVAAAPAPTVPAAEPRRRTPYKGPRRTSAPAPPPPPPPPRVQIASPLPAHPAAQSSPQWQPSYQQALAPRAHVAIEEVHGGAVDAVSKRSTHAAGPVVVHRGDPTSKTRGVDVPRRRSTSAKSREASGDSAEKPRRGRAPARVAKLSSSESAPRVEDKVSAAAAAVAINTVVKTLNMEDGTMPEAERQWLMQITAMPSTPRKDDDSNSLVAIVPPTHFETSEGIAGFSITCVPAPPTPVDDFDLFNRLWSSEAIGVVAGSNTSLPTFSMAGLHAAPAQGNGTADAIISKPPAAASATTGAAAGPDKATSDHLGEFYMEDPWLFSPPFSIFSSFISNGSDCGEPGKLSYSSYVQALDRSPPVVDVTAPVAPITRHSAPASPATAQTRKHQNFTYPQPPPPPLPMPPCTAGRLATASPIPTAYNRYKGEMLSITVTMPPQQLSPVQSPLTFTLPAPGTRARVSSSAVLGSVVPPAAPTRTAAVPETHSVHTGDHGPQYSSAPAVPRVGGRTSSVPPAKLQASTAEYFAAMSPAPSVVLGRSGTVGPTKRANSKMPLPMRRMSLLQSAYLNYTYLTNLDPVSVRLHSRVASAVVASNPSAVGDAQAGRPCDRTYSLLDGDHGIVSTNARRSTQGLQKSEAGFMLLFDKNCLPRIPGISQSAEGNESDDLNRLPLPPHHPLKTSGAVGTAGSHPGDTNHHIVDGDVNGIPTLARRLGRPPGGSAPRDGQANGSAEEPMDAMMSRWFDRMTSHMGSTMQPRKRPTTQVNQPGAGSPFSFRPVGNTSSSRDAVLRRDAEYGDLTMIGLHSPS